MVGQDKAKIIVLIDLAGLVGIGAYAFFSAVYTSDFAELRVQPFFLDFPIFIGELLLMGLCMLFLIKQFLARGWRSWHIAWGAYLIWVALAAFAGYYVWGPVALRNAALFYYACFALLGYSFYNHRIVSHWLFAMVAFLMLMGLVGFKEVGNYYWYTCVILIVVIILKKLSAPWRFFALVGVFIFSHLDSLFLGSRAHMVGIAGAVVFLLAIYLAFLCDFPKRVRLVIAVIMVFLFIVGMVKVADSNSVKSVLNWPAIMKMYRAERKIVEDNQGRYFPKPFPPRVFNPNHPSAPVKAVSAPVKVVSASANTVVAPIQEVSTPVKIAPVVPKESYKYPDIFIKKGVLSQQPSSNQVPVIKATETPVVIVKEVNAPIQESPRMAQPPQQPVHQEPIKMEKAVAVAVDHHSDSGERNLNEAYNNIIFRVFIWRDMFDEWWPEHFFDGVGLGKPQRSRSLEILTWASIEWMRDGWIMPHNSFFHMIYRAGVVGILVVLTLIGVLIHLTKVFIRRKDTCGILLISVLIYWCLQSMFSVTLELPYNAILFWGLLGMTAAYALPKERHET